jgi:hypothetical protein
MGQEADIDIYSTTLVRFIRFTNHLRLDYLTYFLLMPSVTIHVNTHLQYNRRGDEFGKEYYQRLGIYLE